MIHEILPVGMLQCNCSIFGDEQSRESIVIDPGAEIERITEILEREHLKVKAIVITHGHIDHVAGAAKLRALTGAPVYMNERDFAQLDLLPEMAAWLGTATPERPQIDSPANEGMILDLGPAEFHVVETPGHTQGSVSVWIPQAKKIVAGDTLFKDSIGRTDFPGGNARQILSSIKTKLLELPDEAIVIPGHGPVTTIEREKRQNPFLQNL
jgi:glyoxylase-like metal-dependent hydrolase (beta-lactamase superfamily II)